MKDVIMLEKITCPKCKKEYPDIEHIFPKNTIRQCWCGTKFTYVKHNLVLMTLQGNKVTHYYEMKEV